MNKILSLTNRASTFSSESIVIPLHFETSNPTSSSLVHSQITMQVFMPLMLKLFEIDTQSVNPSKIPNNEIVSTVERILDPESIPDDIIYAKLVESDESSQYPLLSQKRRNVKIRITSKRRLSPIKIDEEISYKNLTDYESGE